MPLSIFKLDAVPVSPIANGIYLVRAAGGFDLYVADNLGSLVLWKNELAVVDIYDTAGAFTWNKPTGSKLHRVLLIGGGGGGGSGRRGAAGSARGGGGPGAGGGCSEWSFLSAAVPSSLTVTVGAGGTGGTAVAANDTNGANGNWGGETTFGSLLRAMSGGPGNGGTTSVGSNGPSLISFPGALLTHRGADGGAGSYGSPTGGGAGGSISGANVASAGLGGGAITGYLGTFAGASGGAIGAAGAAGGSSPIGRGGRGGGGGGAALGAAAGAGGAGGSAGAGGGGGGASENGFASGAGGSGAPGLAVIVSLR